VQYNILYMIYIPCQEGTTALHCAAKEGHLAVVKLLLSEGCDIEAADDVSNKL
jgi:ankyrin repeat protein